MLTRMSGTLHFNRWESYKRGLFVLLTKMQLHKFLCGDDDGVFRRPSVGKHIYQRLFWQIDQVGTQLCVVFFRLSSCVLLSSYYWSVRQSLLGGHMQHRENVLDSCP